MDAVWKVPTWLSAPVKVVVLLLIKDPGHPLLMVEVSYFQLVPGKARHILTQPRTVDLTAFGVFRDQSLQETSCGILAHLGQVAVYLSSGQCQFGGAGVTSTEASVWRQRWAFGSCPAGQPPQRHPPTPVAPLTPGCTVALCD